MLTSFEKIERRSPLIAASHTKDIMVSRAGRILLADNAEKCDHMRRLLLATSHGCGLVVIMTTNGDSVIIARVLDRHCVCILERPHETDLAEFGAPEDRDIQIHWLEDLVERALSVPFFSL